MELWSLSCPPALLSCEARRREANANGGSLHSVGRGRTIAARLTRAALYPLVLPQRPRPVPLQVQVSWRDRQSCHPTHCYRSFHQDRRLQPAIGAMKRAIGVLPRVKGGVTWCLSPDAAASQANAGDASGAVGAGSVPISCV
jgi:hypothetical protein